MKWSSALILALSAAALIASADDPKLSIQANPQVGDKSSLAAQITAQIGNGTVEVNTVFVSSITKVDKDRVEMKIDWQKTHFLSNGDEQDMPFEPYQIALGANGDLVSLKGGPGSAEPSRTYLTAHFPRPDKDLAKDESTTFTLAANKDAGTPERKVTETYLGAEDLAGKQALKVKVKVEEVGGKEFVMDGTFWVDSHGNVLKETAHFKNLPLEGTDATVEGDIKTHSVPS